MTDLKQTLEDRAHRGSAMGSERLRQRVALTLAAGKKAGLPHAPGRRLSGPVVALAAAVVALVAIGSVALVLRTRGSPVVERPPPATAPELEEPPPTTTYTEQGPVVLAGVCCLDTVGDSTWAWNEHEIWRYTVGAWSPYSALPSTGDGDPYVTYARDTLWVFNDSTVLSLEEEEWVEVAAVPPDVRGLAEDPNTGVLWGSTGDNLYRWDGEEMTNVGYPPNWLGSDWGYVGGIVVTAGGSVWASGLNAWIPSNGGLARYDDTTSSWETVRPLGGDKDVPAWSMATSRDGDLWVTLSKWSPDWENPATPRPKWALAHLDGATDKWTVYEEDLPEGFPGVMAADDVGVWLGAGASVGDFEPRPGILRFDGRTWTHYLADSDATDTIDSFAIAPDGTIWYTQNRALYQLEP